MACTCNPASEAGLRWWLWPTILSLDAPLVAVLWQRLVGAAAFGPAGGPRAGRPWLLGLARVLGGPLDRGMEARPRDDRDAPPPVLPAHERWPVAALWAAVLALDVTVALRRLPSDRVPGRPAGAGPRRGLPAFAPAGPPQQPTGGLPKELCAALLLGAGAAVFSVGRPGDAPRPDRGAPGSLHPALLFELRPDLGLGARDRPHRTAKPPSPTSSPVRGGPGARLLPWVIAAVSALAWAAGGRGPAAACAAVSGSPPWSGGPCREEDRPRRRPGCWRTSRSSRPLSP
jgi:hypothetical protein